MDDQVKEIAMTIKIGDLMAMIKRECLCPFHTYKASESTRSHPT